MNGYMNRRPAGGNGGGRKSARYGGFKKPRFGRGAGGGKSPGGFGTSRRGRKFKSRAGDDRRGRAGGYGPRSSYEDGFQAGVAHAQRIGYRF